MPKTAVATVQAEPPSSQNSPIPDHQLISVITDPIRWQILEHLGAEQRTPKEIAEALQMKPANCQYHLKILVQAGVVTETHHAEYKNRLLYRRKPLVANVFIEAAEMKAEVFFEE